MLRDMGKTMVAMLDDPHMAGWVYGLACAFIVGVGLIAACAQTPPLREHVSTEWERRRAGLGERSTPWLSVLAVPLWVFGGWNFGVSQLFCALPCGLPGAAGDLTQLGGYARASAWAAVLVLAVVYLPMMYAAGVQIGRRSVR
jgi:hypothetical protein